MFDQSSWPGGPYGVQPQPASNPYLPPDNSQNPSAPPPVGPSPQPVDWGSLNTAKPHSVDRILSGKSRVWMMAVKISAAVVAVFSLVFGVVMCSNVSRWTARLNGGLFTSGQPNTGLAVMIMLGIWIVGLAAAFCMMLAADAADDIRRMGTSGPQR